MIIDADKLLDSAVTVISKVSAKDAGRDGDAYYATVLTPANWSRTQTKTTDADGTVHLTQSSRVQIPATTGRFLSYAEYVSEVTSAPLPGDYTVSLGDVLVRGELALKSPLTRSEVLQAIKGREHFSVSTVRDLRNNGGAEAPASGCLKYVNCIHCEGM